MRSRGIRAGRGGSILWECRFRRQRDFWLRRCIFLTAFPCWMVDCDSLAGAGGLGGFLMVSTWRFWSGKEINLSRSHPFQFLFVLAIVLYVMLRYSNVVFFLIGLTYMFSGIWARAAYGWSRRRRRGSADDDRRPTRATPSRILCGHFRLFCHYFPDRQRIPVYKIAIAGASTLLGRELKEALSESPLAAANFLLLDEDEAQGQLDQVGDEVTFVQAIGADAFETGRLHVFCRVRSTDAQALADGACGRGRRCWI